MYLNNTKSTEYNQKKQNKICFSAVIILNYIKFQMDTKLTGSS